MTKILVDGIEVDVPAEYTLLQACEVAGAEIPRFCFHERLSIAGNCRMCLVELKGAPKPVASCAYAVKDCRPGPNGEPPEVLTRSGGTKKAREGVMEFLLINHPLDCPICDQGGHCDLQDQAMAYGVDSTRYSENKRAVEEKYIGPLVRTAMNRCIHCTRCVRFLAEVAGVPDLGAIGRGEDMEITSYLEQAMNSELQGNVADLCPVGALVHKPQSYNVRPWELSKTESVDVMDAVGSAIRVDARGREVMQIEPRVNEEINEEWISDKTRHAVDGLRVQRLDRPFLRENGRLRPASWAEAFGAIAAKLKGADPKRVGAVVGDLAAVEEVFALKQLMDSLGVANLDCRQAGAGLDPAWGRAAYTFNPTIPGIEQADAILLVGTNPRIEASLLNVRIRKRWRMAPLAVGLIGEPADLTYPHVQIGAGPESLAALARGEHSFLEALKAANHPLIIVGEAAANQPGVLAAAAQLARDVGAVTPDWNGFGVLHNAAARVGALDLGFVPGEGGLDFAGMVGGGVDVLFNLGADECEVAPGAFVIYQGTHGDRGATRADVILPGAAYTEKNATYVNTEGRVQQANRAGFPPGDAREDWAILRAVSDVLGHKLPYDSLNALRRALYAEHPHFAAVGSVAGSDLAAALDRLAGLGGEGARGAFQSPVRDFYFTNPITRASRVLAECSSLARGRALEAAE
ncbi:NADH-quinone oxidoreductase [Methylobacterium gregans]|uniref:NADH-quinone oxidoreductase n=1 Tax=Methylobacterium gregans TaxID=374424 RepID=A0AA37HUK1_9HYPH|nr:NADH-quinone oxidoreductase subunit NuoG [Methylobacterium gregans]MDQ0523365.1 NADH-quinone oxidoreductase subunit G [Methylobacterium gregans]GJD81860.1 NADH-quinone oxidoreductase chain 3 [Methylobacterium gregans]GLS56039.1 NADH-quinone oxidoreductase [Methylobacterium gregans]